jgi:hypothetical protein
MLRGCYPVGDPVSDPWAAWPPLRTPILLRQGELSIGHFTAFG